MFPTKQGNSLPCQIKDDFAYINQLKIFYMTEHFLIWILQQDVDGIIHDVKESNELAKQLGLESE